MFVSGDDSEEEGSDGEKDGADDGEEEGSDGEKDGADCDFPGKERSMHNLWLVNYRKVQWN